MQISKHIPDRVKITGVETRLPVCSLNPHSILIYRNDWNTLQIHPITGLGGCSWKSDYLWEFPLTLLRDTNDCSCFLDQGDSYSLFWFLFETQGSGFFPYKTRTPQGQTQSSHWWVDIDVNGNIFVHHWVLGCIQHAYNYMLRDCSPPSLVFWERLLRKVEPGPSQSVLSGSG